MKKLFLTLSLIFLSTHTGALISSDKPTLLQTAHDFFTLKINLADLFANLIKIAWHKKNYLACFAAGAYTAVKYQEISKNYKNQDKYREKVNKGVKERLESKSYSMTHEELLKTASNIYHWGLYSDPKLVKITNEFIQNLTKLSSKINLENITIIEETNSNQADVQAKIKELGEKFTDPNKGLLRKYTWLEAAEVICSNIASRFKKSA